MLIKNLLQFNGNDEEAVPTDKTVFLLDLGYNGEKGQFTLYDSENL